MKKTSLLIILFIQSISIFSQNQTNRVIYKVGLIESQSQELKNQSDERKNFVSEVKENLSKLECELIFNNSCSVFKVIEKINPNEDSFAYKKAKNFVNGLYYKNMQDSLKVTQVELSGKKYFVKKNIKEYNWLITNETKIIDGYTCYKATCKFEEFDKLRSKQLIFTPEVWFTPSIPSSFGPKGLDGLPGLVLDGRFNDRIYFYATKIEFNVIVEKKSLTLDNKIPIISQEDYNKMLLEINEKLKNE
ncbi:GLPGLI family protein [Flavobacterium sp.]|uniref:GLPGLI family protein n=1 Tax=Flavobacterium sp. TaxID=239 RepID=UPI003753DF0F